MLDDLHAAQELQDLFGAQDNFSTFVSSPLIGALTCNPTAR
jgi:hypothetical protein